MLLWLSVFVKPKVLEYSIFEGAYKRKQRAILNCKRVKSENFMLLFVERHCWAASLFSSINARIPYVFPHERSFNILVKHTCSVAVPISIVQDSYPSNHGYSMISTPVTDTPWMGFQSLMFRDWLHEKLQMLSLPSALRWSFLLTLWRNGLPSHIRCLLGSDISSLPFVIRLDLGRVSFPKE